MLAVVASAVDKYSTSAGSSDDISGDPGDMGTATLAEVICRCGLGVFGECRFQATDQHWLQEVSLLSVLGRLQRTTQDQALTPTPRSRNRDAVIATPAAVDGMAVREPVPLGSLEFTVSSNEGKTRIAMDSYLSSTWTVCPSGQFAVWDPV